MFRTALASLTRDWALKLTALVLAFLLWTSVRAEEPATWGPVNVPVRVLNEDHEWVVAEQPSPASVQVQFRGPFSELLRAGTGGGPEIIVPFDEVDDSIIMRPLSRNWVRMPPGTERVVVTEIIPSEVRVTFDRVSTRLLPVTATLRGDLPPGYELAGAPEIEPSMVRASGAGRALSRIDSLRLPPIDVRDRRALDTLQLTIDTTGTGLIISPRTVRVVVPIRPILSDTAPIPLMPPPGPRSPRD